MAVEAVKVPANESWLDEVQWLKVHPKSALIPPEVAALLLLLYAVQFVSEESPPASMPKLPVLL